MAEQIEIFSILDDGSGDGASPAKTVRGDTGINTKNGMLVHVAKNTSEDADFLNNVGEGDSPTDGLVAMIAKDNSGNMDFLNTDASGNLLVSSEGAGSVIDGEAEVTYSGSGFDDILTLTLSLTKVYTNLEVDASNFKNTVWRIVHIDDAAGSPVETILRRRRTGAGDYAWERFFENFELDTTGGTGVQELVLRAEQQGATASQISGSMAVIES